MTPIGTPSRNSGTPSIVRTPPTRAAFGVSEFRIGPGVQDMDDAGVQAQRGPTTVPRPGEIGFALDETSYSGEKPTDAAHAIFAALVAVDDAVSASHSRDAVLDQRLQHRLRDRRSSG